MNHDVYTISLDAHGSPVQRPLAEMTTAEVLQALAWHHRDADRAFVEYEQAEFVMTEVRFGNRDPGGIEEIAQIMARSATAIGAHLRLCAAIQVVLRRKLGYPGYPDLHFSMPLEELVRLQWSGAAHSVS